MPWAGGQVTASQDAAANPLQERLRGVESAPQWEADEAAEEPPRPPRLTRRLGRVATLPPPRAPQAMTPIPVEWRAPRQAAADEPPGDDDAEDVEFDVDDAIVRHLPPPMPRVPQRGEWLWACWHWLHDFWGRRQPRRRRRGRRLPRVSDAQKGKGA